MADMSIYCIKVEYEVWIHKFLYAVSAIYLFPVWPEMAVGGLFSPVMRILRYVVASRLAQSAMGRQPTTGILLPVQREVNVLRRRRLPRVLSCRPEAFGLLTYEFPSKREWLFLDRK